MPTVSRPDSSSSRSITRSGPAFWSVRFFPEVALHVCCRHQLKQDHAGFLITKMRPPQCPERTQGCVGKLRAVGGSHQQCNALFEPEYCASLGLNRLVMTNTCKLAQARFAGAA